MISAILTSMEGVLFTIHWNGLIGKLAKLCPGMDEDYIREIVLEAAGSDMYRSFIIGEIADDTYLEYVQDNLHVTIPPKSFWDSYFTRDALLRNPLVDELYFATRQKNKSLKLVVVCNMDHYRLNHCIANLKCPISDAVASHWTHSLKPNGYILKTALIRSGCKAAQCLFVDSEVDCVQAASDMGMEAHLFTSAVDLETTLKRHGLL